MCACVHAVMYTCGYAYTWLCVHVVMCTCCKDIVMCTCSCIHMWLRVRVVMCVHGYLYILAGPALFRGRLRAFGKCTNGVASSKGRQNLDSVRLTL